MLAKLSLKKTLITLAGLFTLIELVKYSKSIYHNRTMKRKALQKQSQKYSKILKLPTVPDSLQYEILSLTVTELSNRIKSGSLTSSEIVSTYINRARTIGRSLSLTTEELFEEALLEAKKCDEEQASGILRGSLHGIPISLKDHFSVKGCQTTSGLAWKLDFVDEETFILVELLKADGAIPFVRSNVSQGMMWVESANRIYGRSLNPWEPNRTPGGSSGGEAGLVCARASPLGIGSDISGSIRCPAHFCGVYAFIPTPQRLPKAWIPGSRVHCAEVSEPVLECSYGPIGRCVDDLALVLRCWLSGQLFQRKPEVVPLKFEDSEFFTKAKKKIAVFKGNQFFSIAECIKNAISTCQERLANNSEIIEYEFLQLKKLNKLFNRLLAVGGNEGMLKTLNGEDPEDYLKVLMFTNDHPYLTSTILTILKAFGQERISELCELPEIHKPQDFLELFQEIQQVTLEIIQDWDRLAIDALICPTFGVVAAEHGRTVEVVTSLVYSYIWNLLGFCAGVVPVGLVDKNSASFDDDFDDILTNSFRSVMKDSEGLPYSIQVVGLPFRDESVLNVMKRVESIFGFHKYAC